MKNKHTKKSTVPVVIATVSVILFCILFGTENFVVGTVRTVFSPVLSLTSKTAYEIKSLQSYFTEIKSYKEENSRLARENAELRRAGLSVAQYKEENDRLKELLELKGEMEEHFVTTPALVVSYEPNNWYDTIVVNKGSYSGIEVGDCVISDDGIVGKVSEVGMGYSVISTLLNTDNAIGVRIIRNNELAIVEGDTELSRHKLCKMSYMDKSDVVNLGDLIETTGAGGIYPEGIVVGAVKEVKAENSGQYAVIEPAVNVTELHEVLIISRED